MGVVIVKACIEMAKVYGIGMACIKHSNHFGMSAWLVQRALDEGLMSLVFTNSSPALPVSLLHPTLTSSSMSQKS